ncbi:MAG TPA: hypothetical protein VEG84_02805 [Thermoanaerobaculia bacterium]|nr:hypothetical protein [Thermoanaerobaculia bacterium]
MQRVWKATLAGILAATLAGCASGAKPNNPSQAGKGSRVIEAVVVDRQYEPPTSSRSTGTYSLAFEARDGEATVRYHFPVTRTQYNRYVEGTHVQLVMSDDELRDIRPLP